MYILYSYYIYIYIAYICRVKSEGYINRKSFTTYIVQPTCSMVLRIASSGNKVRGCPGSIPGRVLKIGKKSIHNIYVLYILYICNIYCIYLICILYIYIYILHIYVETKV